MTTVAQYTVIVAGSAFALAFVFGFVAQRANFCTMGSIADIVTMGSWTRMRTWLLAIAVGIIGATLLDYAGLIDLSKSFYQRPNLLWLSHLVGGAVFGIGMVLASGCGSKTLIRVGGGNLKSLVVLAFLGISAYTTLRGLFGLWRRDLLDRLSIDLAAHGIGGQDLPTLLASATGLEQQVALLLCAVLVTVPLLVFIFSDAEFRRDKLQWSTGIVIGLVVTGGWYASGHLGFGENPDTLEEMFFATNSRAMESFSFIAPVAYTFELLMMWSDRSLGFTFGIAAVLGMIAGAAISALMFRTFRWESFASVNDTRNHIIGGVLMGFGGVTALGCTVGQGLTGLSTLALGAFLTFGGIVAGAAATVKYQYWLMLRES